MRGTEAADVCNCRCCPIPVNKWQWAKLAAAGARIADGYDSAVPNFAMAA
jgi:hypothetical protein